MWMKTAATNVVCVLLTATTAFGGITTGPLNTALNPGPAVIFQCDAEDVGMGNPRVQWFEHITSGDGTGVQISDNDVILAHPHAARYSIINVTGGEYSFDLQIEPSEMTDGGMYQCHDVQDGMSPKYAQLTTLDGIPICDSNIPASGYVREDVYYTIECHIDYQGQYLPRMHWTFDEPFGQTSTTTNTSVWSGISVTMTRYMDYKFFTMLTNFTQQMFIQGSATNVPTWNHTFQSPRLVVEWDPKSMYIVPEQPSYEIGQFIECHADANPSATFFIQNIDTLQRWDSFRLDLTSDMVGHHRMRCNAANNITGTVYTNDLFFNLTVNPITTPPTTTTTTPAPTIPPDQPCDDLTGRWAAYSPHFIDMCLEVDNSNAGRMFGIIRNDTDPYFVDIHGRVNPYQYGQFGLTGIWPNNIGTLTLVGVCRKCHGVETMQVNGIRRNAGDNPSCEDHGPYHLYDYYQFNRTGYTCRGLLEEHRRSMPIPLPQHS